MEGLKGAILSASGMSAISNTIMQICNSGDEIVCSRTIYGGTYALMKNYLPKFNIHTKFVDITDVKQIENAIFKKIQKLFIAKL